MDRAERKPHTEQSRNWLRQPIHWALGFAVLTTLGCAAGARPLDNQWPQLWLLFDLGFGLLLVSRRRVRFAAAAWFACSPALRLIHTKLISTELAVATVATGLLCAVAIQWPRRHAAREREPLPSLPLSWVATATAVVGFTTVMAATASGIRDRELLLPLLSTLTLFAILSLAPGGKLGLLIRMAAAAAVIAVDASLGGGGARRSTGIVEAAAGDGVLRAAATLSFCAAFEWLRSACTPVSRFVRTTGFVFALSLIAPLLVAPAQIVGLAPFGLLLLHASALGIVLALAPRVGGLPSRRFTVARPGWPRSLSVWGLGFVSIIALTVMVEGWATFHEVWPIAVVFMAVPLVLVRARLVRNLLAVAAVVGCAALFAAVRGPLQPLVVAVALAACAYLLSAPAVARHFVRRVRLSAPARPRTSLALGLAAALTLTIAVGQTSHDPGRAPMLVSSLYGPVAIPTNAFAPTLETDGVTPPHLRAGEPLAIDPLGRGTFVIDEEHDAVSLVDKGSIVHRLAACEWPQEIVVDDDGTAFVSCRGSGRVLAIHHDRSVTMIEVGTEPRALAIDSVQGQLYVGLVTDRRLVTIDIRALVVTAARTLDVEPFELALNRSRVAVLPRRATAVHLVTRGLGRVERVPLYVGNRQSWHGQAIVATGNDLVVVHAGVDTGLERPTSSGGYGGGVREPVELFVSVLRDGRPAVYPNRMVRKRQLHFAEDVTGAAVRDGKLYLVSRGNARLLQCDLGGASPTSRCDTLVSDATGITGIAFDDDGHAVSLAAFDRKIVGGQMSPRGGAPTVRPAVSIGPARIDPELARGRALFHLSDSRMSSSRIACVTCHPDGREDGLVWRLKGARRQTPMLAGRLAETAPFDWNGQSENLESNIGQTIQRLQGTGISPAETKALARYIVEGLRQPVLPSASGDPEHQQLVAHGERLFVDETVGCVRCHVPGLEYTGVGPQDVRSTSQQELAEMRRVDPAAQPEKFDVPSLRYVSLTAPYFHDGSIATLEQLIDHNDDRMGTTSQLGSEDRRALVAYLESL